MGEIVVILSLAVIAPLVIILHFVTKWRESKGLSNEDEKMLACFIFRAIYLSVSTPRRTFRNSALVCSYFGGRNGIMSITRRQIT